MKPFNTALTLLILSLIIFSCKDDEVVTPPPMMGNLVDNPASYVFARDGETTVSFSDQTERANMLSAMKEYLLTGDSGEIIEATTFKLALSNDGNNGGGLFDFTSTNQLGDQVFGPDIDQDFFGNLFEQAAIASKAEKEAEEGEPGLIIRETKGTTILVNPMGHEFTQFIEKGLMGSVFLNQIYNTYLTDERTGDNVENDTLVEGQNYTALEHHWDEAFGYFQAPGDFESNWPEEREDELKFWSNYSNIVDLPLAINDRIMDAFRDGRAAIVANDLSTKNENRDILYTELELLVAATTIHYINQSLVNLNAGNTGEFMHTLSEAFMFARALTYSPKRVIIETELYNILNVDFGFGGNFWTANADGLNTAKEKLVTSYPSLASVKDEL